MSWNIRLSSFWISMFLLSLPAPLICKSTSGVSWRTMSLILSLQIQNKIHLSGSSPIKSCRSICNLHLKRFPFHWTLNAEQFSAFDWLKRMLKNSYPPKKIVGWHEVEQQLMQALNKVCSSTSRDCSSIEARAANIIAKASNKILSGCWLKKYHSTNEYQRFQAKSQSEVWARESPKNLGDIL